jgi:hypothetical protein
MVEDVPEGGSVAVTVCSPPVVEIFAGARSGNAGEGPHEADGREAVVFYVSPANGKAATGTSSHRGGARECF